MSGVVRRQAARRTALALAFSLTALAATPPAARAGGVHVLVMRSSNAAPYESAVKGFRHEYGAPFEELTLDGVTNEAALATVRTKSPDVIVAVGLRAALFARDRISDVPVVFCAVAQPERYELGGTRLTGVASDVPAADVVHAIAKLAPDVHDVAVFTGPTPARDLARLARRGSGESPRIVPVVVKELNAFANEARRVEPNVQAFWLHSDPDVATPETFQFLLGLSVSKRKPLFVFSDALVRSGAMAAVVPDYERAGVEAAAVLRRLLAGERPADLPIVASRGSRVVVNGAAVTALGRTLPPESLRGVEQAR